MFHDDLSLVTSLLRPLATLQLPRTDLSVYSHKLSTKLTLVDVTRSYKLITERRVKACQFSLTSAPSLQFLFISAQSSSEFGIFFLLLLESSLPLFSREFLIDYHNILDGFCPKKKGVQITVYRQCATLDLKNIPTTCYAPCLKIFNFVQGALNNPYILLVLAAIGNFRTVHNVQQ